MHTKFLFNNERSKVMYLNHNTKKISFSDINIHHYKLKICHY